MPINWTELNLKECKIHENCGKPMFCLMDKKMISPQIE